MASPSGGSLRTRNVSFARSGGFGSPPAHGAAQESFDASNPRLRVQIPAKAPESPESATYRKTRLLRRQLVVAHRKSPRHRATKAITKSTSVTIEPRDFAIMLLQRLGSEIDDVKHSFLQRCDARGKICSASFMQWIAEVLSSSGALPESTSPTAGASASTALAHGPTSSSPEGSPPGSPLGS
eukprot:RCo047440